ncbi:hypothetical protein BDP81DRAFT_414697, partial [Colletotrichum phormii]
MFPPGEMPTPAQLLSMSLFPLLLLYIFSRFFLSNASGRRNSGKVVVAIRVGSSVETSSFRCVVCMLMVAWTLLDILGLVILL